MPTSATGTPTPERGFTLIELLVVVLIVGLISAVVLLSVRGGGEERLAREEIRRLDRLVTLAADESVYRLVELGVEFTAHGYRFLTWDGTAWAPLVDPGPLDDHQWPVALTATLVVDGRPMVLGAEYAVDAPLPQVVFLSSGDMNAFTLELVADNRRGERLTAHITAETEREAIGDLP